MGPDGQDYLVVTTGFGTLLKDYVIQTTEGYGYDHEFAWGGGWGFIGSDGEHVHVYRLEDDPSGLVEVEIADFEGGGSRVHVPRVQVGDLEIFHNQAATDPDPQNPPPPDRYGVGVCRWRIDPAFPAAPIDIVTRAEFHTRGRLSFQVAVDRSNPDNQHLILPCGNDGIVPLDGFLVTRLNPATSEWEIKSWDDHDPCTGPCRGDDRGPNGLQIDPESQWTSGTNLRRYFVGGADPDVDDGFEMLGNGRSQLLELSVTSDVWGVSPDRVKNAFFVAPLDDFETRGRQTYNGGYRGPFPVDNLLFATRTRSVYGLVAFELAPGAETALDAGNPPDSDNFSYFIEDLGGTGTWSNLVTHPEFNEVPRDDTSTTDETDLWMNNDLGHTSPTYSWTPRLVEVNPEGGTGLGAWVLAVPCGTIRADPEWKVFADAPPPTGHGHPNWLYPPGSIWHDKFSHGLVQFFPIIELSPGEYWPETISKDKATTGGVSPLSALIGPDANGMIWKVLSVAMPTGQAGATKVYLFSVDFGGRVYVHEIQDILSMRDPDAQIDNSLMVADWRPSALLSSYFDDLPETVWDIVIDYPGSGTKANVYVSVRRVGVQILEFDPTLPAGQRFTELDLIQTAEYAMGLVLRTVEGERQLVVSDHGGGIRVFGD